jgi:hypothetical protein
MRWFLRAAVIIGTIAPAIPADAQGLKVVEGVFTPDVGPDKRYTLALERTGPVKPVFLWTMIKADQQVLDRLEKERKLPIYHLWYYYGDGITPQYQSESLQHEQSLDVGSADNRVFESLRNQLKDHSVFTWRTWSRKTRVAEGHWKVEIVYRDLSPVPCGEHGEACVFWIRLTR